MSTLPMARSRQCFALPRLFVAALLMLGASTVQALSCPPGAAAGAAGPIAGKPGETGWKLDTETDDKGNKIEIYCLLANAKHGGDDFGMLYTPKGGKGVWVGACVFGCGRNRHDKDFVDKKGGMGGKPNGIPDEFTGATWFNAEPPPGGTKDWDFSFDPKTGKLTIKKTEGKWSDIYVDPKDGKKKRDYTSKEVDTDTIDAPENFEDLKFKGSQLTSLDGTDGLERGAFAALQHPSGIPGLWDLTLRANAIGGSGTEADPYDGLIAQIFAGDSFVLGGSGLNNPSVGGLAALAAYGGWTVSDFDSDYVRFVATADAVFAPGTDIPGFNLRSAGSTLYWDVDGSEAVDSSGVVAIPEPGGLAMTLGALGALGWLRARRAGHGRVVMAGA